MRKLYYNGKILCVESGEYAQAVLTEDGKIIAVGEEAYLRELGGRRAEAVDLAGGTLIPGFVGGGRFLRDAMQYFWADLCPGLAEYREVDFSRLFSLLSGFDRIYEDTPGRILAVKGLPLAYSRALCRENNPLYDSFLHRPLFVLAAGESVGFVNRAGVVRWNLPEACRGIISGALLERTLCEMPLPSLRKRQKALADTGKRYAARGVTTLWESWVTEAHLPWLRAFSRERGAGQLLYGDSEIEQYERLKRAYPAPAGGFCLRALHAELDGASWQAGGSALYYSDRAISLALSMAIAEGIHISFGAHGEDAVEQLLRVAGAMSRARPGFVRLRVALTEVMHLCPERGRMEALRRLGIVPIFAMGTLAECAETLCALIGWEETQSACPAADALRCRVPFALDATRPGALPVPLETAFFAAFRRDGVGVPFGTGQSIDWPAALRALTLMSAYALGLEEDIGSIRAGKAADFVWLDGDLSAPDSDSPPAARLRGTFVRDEFFSPESSYGISTHNDRVPSIY